MVSSELASAEADRGESRVSVELAHDVSARADVLVAALGERAGVSSGERPVRRSLEVSVKAVAATWVHARAASYVEVIE
jgi:hypothetical protein